MKSCLKRSTSAPEVLYQARPGVSGDAQSKEQNRKSVSFSEDGEEEVFYAEDWDRSPAAVTQRLTYRCVQSNALRFQFRMIESRSSFYLFAETFTN